MAQQLVVIYTIDLPGAGFSENGPLFNAVAEGRRKFEAALGDGAKFEVRDILRRDPNAPKTGRGRGRKKPEGETAAAPDQSATQAEAGSDATSDAATPSWEDAPTEGAQTESEVAAESGNGKRRKAA